MSEQGLYVVWFCFLVWPGQAQVPEPAQCLVSGVYSLVQLPDAKDEKSCWDDCFAEPDCHVAVVTKALSGSHRCLLVNCLNQGNYSVPRDPSSEIQVYPKSSISNEQRQFLMDRTYGLANERLHCSDLMNYSSCQSGIPRFFYNGTSYRCERFFSGCGSSRNTFETQEACEALCNEKFRCYRPRQSGGCNAQFSKFFYNVTSGRCERFVFSGCGSNGNMFSTAVECEALCADVKGNSYFSTSQSVTTGSPGSSPPSTTRPTGSAVLYFVVPLVFLMLVFLVCMQHHRWSQRPSPTSDKTTLLSESDQSIVES
ncbi:papilin-like isoform X2 [Anabas testudineus]|uniref:papilin-like isoform X2 n=1 Tax=Anabas testudineus TaxID=64144 RepID=UPI000E4590B7|nr:papilin-like isoform X2 [Anabas testudineus]